MAGIFSALSTAFSLTETVVDMSDKNLSDKEKADYISKKIDVAHTELEEYEEIEKQKIDQYLEYEEIPRGRVIFNIKMNQTIVYMDAKLFKKPIAQKVASFFDLDFEQVKWKKDPHYYTIK